MSDENFSNSLTNGLISIGLDGITRTFNRFFLKQYDGENSDSKLLDGWGRDIKFKSDNLQRI